MPIEIRELHIRVSVDTVAGKPAAGGQAGAPAAESPDKDAIIAACVEQVMQILQAKKER